MSASTTHPTRDLAFAPIEDRRIVVTEISDEPGDAVFGGVLHAYRRQGFEAGYSAAMRDALLTLQLGAAELLRSRGSSAAPFVQELLVTLEAHLNRAQAAAGRLEQFVEDGLGI